VCNFALIIRHVLRMGSIVLLTVASGYTSGLQFISTKTLL